MKLSRVVGYVENALAFLLSDDTLFKSVRTVWLFGSAVRNELTANSDIDIFLDCKEDDSKTVSLRASVALNQFYESRDFEKWKLLGIENPISLQAGTLEKWKLRTSVYAEGLIMFSKSSEPKKYVGKMLIVIELPKNKKQYLKVIREFFGRSEYKTAGIIRQAGGIKISSNAFIIPKEAFSEISNILQTYKIEYRIFEFLTVGD